ncbi:MAG: VOC family protein [Alphaproteobacteria bacterium]|jgi:catechol 2,3-dioxygenase-like lactoylglutathione lyase family enzyme|nr:VOC family protein [Alphaproteobacteria bacterium]PHX99076.1 MAG: lactoylglutathione lyase [Rhodospirillaceae bacterium]
MPMLKRINLCVADMERSLKVYRDILGFTVNYMKDSASDSYSYPVFMFPKEAKLRFATLDSPTQERTFALTEVRGIELPKLPVPHMTAVVLNCINFDEVVAKATAMGLKVIPEQALPDLDGKPKGRETAFVDPDGHLIVLYKMLNQ